jgi:hypothetical protein
MYVELKRGLVVENLGGKTERSRSWDAPLCSVEKLPLRHGGTQLRPAWRTTPIGKQKADVAECPEAFDHVGLLSNEPSSLAGLLFI